MDYGWTVEFHNNKVEAEFDELSADLQAKIVHITQLIEEFGIRCQLLCPVRDNYLGRFLVA